MGLFRRKPLEHEIEERCPHCGEPVPDGAAECMMCGVDLRPLLAGKTGTSEESAGTAGSRRL